MVRICIRCYIFHALSSTFIFFYHVSFLIFLSFIILCINLDDLFLLIFTLVFLICCQTSAKILNPVIYLLSVQFSSVASDSLWTHRLKHARPPCPSPTPRVYSNSHPQSRWCHPTISSSVVPFSSCPQSLPASGSFQISQLFASGGQTIGISASPSVLSMNIQDWFPLEWTGWISLLSKGLKILSNTTVQKHQLFGAQFSLWSNSHIHTWLLENL